MSWGDATEQLERLSFAGSSGERRFSFAAPVHTAVVTDYRVAWR